MIINTPKSLYSYTSQLLTSGVQVDKIVDVVKQEKKRENIGKENLDENVDDPPPAVPVKPAREIGGEDIINIKQQVYDCIFSVQRFVNT